MNVDSSIDTYDKLVLMIKCMLGGKITSSDEVLLKYKDEGTY